MLQDGLWSRFFPAVEHARHLIEEGAIGDVVMVQADFDALASELSERIRAVQKTI